MRPCYMLSIGLVMLTSSAAIGKTKGAEVVGKWKVVGIRSPGGDWVRLVGGRQWLLTLERNGKGTFLMQMPRGDRRFPVSWRATGSKLTLKMLDEQASTATGLLAKDGKSLVTTQIDGGDGTQTKYVRIR